MIQAAFFLSGFAALLYQIVWQRMPALFAGSDAVSATLVVGAFLLGLGIGSLAAGSVADRLSSRRAVRAFALCELGIGCYGLFSRYLFHDLPLTWLDAVPLERTPLFGLIMAGLLLPTALMGMSLPLLARAVVREIEGASRRIGWLYAVNTVGAGLGAWLGGLLIIGAVGYAVCLVLAAALNATIAAVAWVGARRLPAGDGASARSSTVRAQHRAPRDGRVWLWCALVFASGFLIISLEIVWFRALGLLLESRAFAFALILGCFLIGDAVGIGLGALAARRLRNPRRFFLALQGVVALYAIGALWAVYAVHAAPGVTGLFIGREEAASARVWLATAALLAGTVLPPAVLLGMSFPITQQVVQDDLGAVGRRVGLVQLANILGNTAGALVTGLVLLDIVGTPGTLRIVAALGLAFTVPLTLGRLRPIERWRAAGLAATLALAALAFPDGARWWERLHGAPGIAAEDRTGVVFMARDPIEARMFIGGHSQSSVPFQAIHGALGLLGPLVHPDPRRVLVIGHGTGGTPFAAGANPRTERIRVIDIVAPVYAVLERFAETPEGRPVRRLLADPRIRRTVADARHRLFTTAARYDVIEADAIYPRSSNSGLLYSVEFFRQARERLAPGGIYVQWAATARTEAGVEAVFPHVVRVGPILLASDTPIRLDRERLLDRMCEPDTAGYLRRGGWHIRELVRLVGLAARAIGPGAPRPEDYDTDLFPKDEYAFSGPKFGFFPFRRFPE